MPNSTWGGEGSMGCGIGYGYLHRIPSRPEDEEKHEEKTPLIHNVELQPQTQQLEQQQQQQQQQHQQQQQQQQQQQSQPTKPVVVYDHQHEHKVINANPVPSAPEVPLLPVTAAFTQSYGTQQSADSRTNTSESSVAKNVSSISLLSESVAKVDLNESGDHNRFVSISTPGSTAPLMTRQSESSTFPSYSSGFPSTQIGQSFYSTTNTSKYNYTSPYYSTGQSNLSSYETSIPTYSTSTSFTTPISLPGMPPLTVSATLPTDKFTNLPLPSHFQQPQLNQEQQPQTFYPNLPSSNQPTSFITEPTNQQSYTPQL